MAPSSGSLPHWWSQTSFWAPLVVAHHTLVLALRLACCLLAANHSPLPKPDLRLEPQYPAPLVGAFEVRVCRSAPTDRAGLSLLCPLHTCHHALRLRRSPSVSTDLPASKETFPLSQLPPRATGPVLIPSSLFFFCLTQLHGDFLALLEVWGPLSAFSRCSVRIIPHVDAFLTYLWGDGELHVLFLCHLHSLPTDLWDIIYIQCKVIGYNISDWNLSKIFWMLNV